METEGFTDVPAKKTTLTPKAIIYQKFGQQARYEVKEVGGHAENGCPGLAISQKEPTLFRCCLHLPKFSVMSATFKRKRDAEQSAAETALEKLRISPREDNPTIEEAWNRLISRLSYFFSDEFLSCIQPLSGHFRAALHREAHLSGLVPVSVISVYDKKIVNLCKFINPEVDSNPLMVMSLIFRAATRLHTKLSSLKEYLSLQRKNPYPPDIIRSSMGDSWNFTKDIGIEAIRIPSSLEKNVESLSLTVSFRGYYLDAIAKELGVTNAAEVLISRTIGKASSELRIYYCVPKSYLLDPLSEQCAKLGDQLEEPLNVRATYLSGQTIYGNAILISAGYTWKNADFYYEDVSLCSYYRLIINKTPCGIHKLSREAMLAAELPFAFTPRNSWQGSFPKDILCTFCRQHHLSEPVFSISSSPLELSLELLGSKNKTKIADSGEEESIVILSEGGKSMVTEEYFRCEIRIFSKCQDLLMKYSPKNSYKKQNDAVQNASLKVLSWFNTYFSDFNTSLEELISYGNKLDIQLCPSNLFEEFKLCASVHDSLKGRKTQLKSDLVNQLDAGLKDGVLIKIAGLESGATPSSGSLVCISYRVSLVTKEKHLNELLESRDEFEFEMGMWAVLPLLESVVARISVGQSASFDVEQLPSELILAAARDTTRVHSLLSLGGCCLEYNVTLLRVTEALEERMEQALFNPPLAKQRVEFALKHIKESFATSLVDFGCGSGSLLDSLLEYPSSLEKITGVDISQKGLTRAAKTLHSKLSTNSGAQMRSSRIKSAVLYEGSIMNFDSRLHGFDIGTCLEVIEHMEEDEASLFGDMVLSSFLPSILIISTPNYEYNVILQKSSLQSQEEDLDEKSQPTPCKFRNHDHKFEWTREQFSRWATDLAERHDYAVEFSGVGGTGDVDPGFASQIAVFRRRDSSLKNVGLVEPYKVIWEWGGSNI